MSSILIFRMDGDSSVFHPLLPSPYPRVSGEDVGIDMTALAVVPEVMA